MFFFRVNQVENVQMSNAVRIEIKLEKIMWSPLNHFLDVNLSFEEIDWHVKN